PRAASAAGEARQKMVKREHPVDRDNQLAVENERCRLQSAERIRYLWKGSREQFGRLGVKFYLLAVFEREAAEPVPFRFVLPALALRDCIGGHCFHGKVSR